MKSYFYLFFVFQIIVSTISLTAQNEYGWLDIDSAKIQKYVPSKILQFGVSPNYDTIYTFSADNFFRKFNSENGKLIFEKEIIKPGREIKFLEDFSRYYYFDTLNYSFCFLNTYNDNQVCKKTNYSVSHMGVETTKYSDFKVKIDNKNHFLIFSCHYTSDWWAPSGFEGHEESGVCQINKYDDNFNIAPLAKIDKSHSGPEFSKDTTKFVFTGYSYNYGKSHGTDYSSNTSSFIAINNPSSNKTETIISSNGLSFPKIRYTDNNDFLLFSSDNAFSIFDIKNQTVISNNIFNNTIPIEPFLLIITGI
jgi:hypothetical protein